MAISIALINLTLFLESIFFDLAESNFLSIVNNFSAEYLSSFLRSFQSGFTSGKFTSSTMDWIQKPVPPQMMGSFPRFRISSIIFSDCFLNLATLKSICGLTISIMWWGMPWERNIIFFVARSFGALRVLRMTGVSLPVTFPVPMSIPRNICRLSAEIISPLNFLAILMAISDFPEEVGPRITRILFLLEFIIQIWRNIYNWCSIMIKEEESWRKLNTIVFITAAWELAGLERFAKVVLAGMELHLLWSLLLCQTHKVLILMIFSGKLCCALPANSLIRGFAAFKLLFLPGRKLLLLWFWLSRNSPSTNPASRDDAGQGRWVFFC